MKTERSTVNVLLVEDNDIDAEGVARAFARHRIANPVHRAVDGVDALEKLRAGAVPKPLLILLDLKLPRMSGLEFLRELRATPEFHDTVVFVLTTSKADEDKTASYAQHIAGYMVKSEVGAGFLRLVELLGAYWRVVELQNDHASPP